MPHRSADESPKVSGWIEVQTMLVNTKTMKVKPQCIRTGVEGLQVGATVTVQHMERFRKYLNGCRVIISKSNHLSKDGPINENKLSKISSGGGDPWRLLKVDRCVEDTRCSFVLTMCEPFSPVTREDLGVMRKAREYLEWHGGEWLQVIA